MTDLDLIADPTDLDIIATEPLAVIALADLAAYADGETDHEPSLRSIGTDPLAFLDES